MEIDRLALTFGRPVTGVHKKTSVLIFYHYSLPLVVPSFLSIPSG